MIGLLFLSLLDGNAQAQETMTLEGVMVFNAAWRTEGLPTPCRLELTRPVLLPGDGICETERATEIELFDAREARYREFVGKRVIVTGALDCPRGGHVLRDISIRLR